MNPDRFLTIPGFESMTEQEVFDTSVAHIANTRKPSIGTIPGEKGDRCVYSGSGCAAAPFLREDAREQADGIGSWGVLAWNGYAPNQTHRELVKSLQHAHDAAWDKHSPEGDAAFMRNWKGRMEYVAKMYHLDASKLEAVEV